MAGTVAPGAMEACAVGPDAAGAVQLTPGEEASVLEQTAVAEADRLKAAGNRHFQEGLLEAALESYGAAMEALEETAAGNDRRAPLASNQALCLLRLGRFREAEERASAALAADPAFGKASYRRGLARLELADPRGAYEDLQRALRLDPNNKDVRARCEEARKLAEAAPLDSEEVALASGAATALGGPGGGLYSEKEDLNEGRLAETYREQKEWVDTITDWTEISDVSFVDEEDKSCISVYMGLPGLQSLPTNRICVWMRPNSLEVRVIDLNGKNWMYVARELWGQIDAEASTWKARRDKLSLKLQKRASARTWDRWEKLRRI